MSKPLHVTVFDPETEASITSLIEPGNYAIICAMPCWLAGEQHHATGTTVLTLKGRNPGLMGTKEVGHG